MADATKSYWPNAGCVQNRDQSCIADRMGTWTFSYDSAQVPKVSSSFKRVYKGMFTRNGMQPMAARALEFRKDALEAFGQECANLGRLNIMGVGPRLFAITQANLAGGSTLHPVIIEQDAGKSLLSQLGGSEDGSVLLVPGTPQREIQNAKVMYDICVQLYNAHRVGLYHRDLRCENVCVRRFGPNPEDIRATIIDFDLGARIGAGEPAGKASLYNTLFREFPCAVFGAYRSSVPSPLELDMGYLAVLQFHLYKGEAVLNGEGHSVATLYEFKEYLCKNVKYFGYHDPKLPPYARELTKLHDLNKLGKKARLVPVNGRTFPYAQLLAHAKTYNKPFFDGEDLQMCNNSAEAKLAAIIDQLAHAVFESYNALRREQGKPVDCKRMEDQSPDLIRSNYAQAEHIPVKVRALGYELEPKSECDSKRVVTTLSDQQIEILARLEHERFVEERIAAGWTQDDQATSSDPSKKTSPYLVPYDQLEDHIKEYDRNTARSIIPLLNQAGLAMVRP